MDTEVTEVLRYRVRLRGEAMKVVLLCYHTCCALRPPSFALAATAAAKLMWPLPPSPALRIRHYIVLYVIKGIWDMRRGVKIRIACRWLDE